MSRVQAIERAFVVLGTLGDGPLGVTEAAARAGLPKSTVARLLGALVAAGAVEQVPGGTDYRVGGRMADPGRAAGGRRAASWRSRARTWWRWPGRWGRRPACRSPTGTWSITSTRSTRLTRSASATGPGTRLPMHAVSSGLVMLAHRPPAEVDAYLARPLERFTPATVVEPAAVRERLRRVLLDGYAWTAEEVAEGITSVAAALADEDGEVVAAIHVHGPSYRFPADAGASAAIAVEVVAAAARIAARIRQA